MDSSRRDRHADGDERIRSARVRPQTHQNRQMAGHRRQGERRRIARRRSHPKKQGLDFIAISDHNTITQLDFFEDVQSKEPAFLIVPGVELTTYKATRRDRRDERVDHEIGEPGVTIESAAEAINGQGAI
jgi:hypothetical protein